MDVSLCLLISICTIILLTNCLAGQSITGQTGPGISSCFYLGNINTTCGIPKIVEVKYLPESCTSFVAFQLAVKTDFNVYTPQYRGYSYGFLQTLGKTGKNMYIYYEHENIGQFLNTVNGDEAFAMKEINNLIAVMKDIPGITGLLIMDFLELPAEFHALTDKVVKYIELLKKKACVEVGLLFKRKIIDYCDNPSYSWMDFTILNSHVNFYVISLEKFNDKCTADLRDTGIAPMNGKANYTLEKLECGIKNANILKEKLYFMFDLRATENIEGDSESFCGGLYHDLCASPGTTKDWCADTIKSFYDKGSWAKQNGVGFVGRFVDIDDPQNTCQCGAFPSFNAILAGVKGSTKPLACSLFDREP